MHNHLIAFWNRGELWTQYGNSPDYEELKLEVISLVPEGIETILDVGSGNGIITNALNQIHDLVALDISSEALKYIDCPSCLGSIVQMPFSDSSFDLVICLEVLEHLISPTFEKGLSELMRVAGEYLLIGVPYKENLAARVAKCPKCGKTFNTDTHFRSFNKISSLTELFPSFQIQSSSLIGQLYRRTTSFGMWVQHSIAKAYLPWQSYFVCINCGFSDSNPLKHKRSLRERVACKVNRIISLINNPIQNWLLVLLRKVRSLEK